MKTWCRLLLIIMLALLPLRGWAQVVMLADSESAVLSLVAAPVPEQGMADMGTGMHDHAAMTTSQHGGAQPPASDAHSGCSDHAHQLCVVCGMAAASLPAPLTSHPGPVQQSCPIAASTGWHSAEARALLRPPRL
ncbi:MAG: hypothetical protein KGL51_05060 [Betaproteobacteria bacterium]|nr:hypothetical protein [Betaproteobacteria bacterium]MDE2124198.1 hypothetical protein [Betaproteobacteria bacterium]MDE2186939.1 hypothetical protein [Betaproteobacteria bacterium]MDE2324026.1 hypothetical protein [Betaproteobacteria bacterium]